MLAHRCEKAVISVLKNWPILGEKSMTRIVLAATVILILILLPMISLSFYRYTVAFQNGEQASIVLGQSNFTSSNSGENESGLAGPEGIAIDSKGNVWISDSENNRVLEFTLPFSNGESASLVLGQENFSNYSCGAPTPSDICDPQGIAFDKSGDLFVADNGNNRILEFKPPFTDGESASAIVGTAENETSRSSLNSPIGVALDSSNNLWVADEGDQRVVEFSAPIFTNESASIVIGQPDFISNSSGTNQTGLDSPDQLVFDHSGDLWVSDSGNSRVLEFSTPLRTGEIATVVIGQPNFTATLQGPTQSVVSVPSGLAFDSAGNLWVADTFNGRVLEFVTPFVNGENATLVIGKNNFNSSETYPTQSQLSGPEGLAFDTSGNLWVLDTASNRALEFTLSGVATSPGSSLEVTTSSIVTQSSSSATASYASATTSTQEASFLSTFSISAITSSSSYSTSPESTSLTSYASSPARSASSLSSSYSVVLVTVTLVCLFLYEPVFKKSSNRALP